jgi:hypothetical protein
MNPFKKYFKLLLVLNLILHVVGMPWPMNDSLPSANSFWPETNLCLAQAVFGQKQMLELLVMLPSGTKKIKIKIKCQNTCMTIQYMYSMCK